MAKSSSSENVMGLQADSAESMAAADIFKPGDVGAQGAAHLIASNIKIITVAALALIVGAGAIMYYFSSSEENNMSASLQLSRVKSYYDAGEWEKALTGDAQKMVRGEAVIGLKEITEEYGRSEAGRAAALYAGMALINQKKYDEAAEYLDHAAGSSSAVVAIGAKAGLAQCKENGKDYTAAAALYEDAAGLGKNAGMEERYQYFAAINFEKAGQVDKATALYTDLVIKNSATEIAGEAKNSLARLGTIIE